MSENLMNPCLIRVSGVRSLREELIQELIKAKITEARLKKGYEVKGDGTVILYGNKIIK